MIKKSGTTDQIRKIPTEVCFNCNLLLHFMPKLGFTTFGFKGVVIHLSIVVVVKNSQLSISVQHFQHFERVQNFLRKQMFKLMNLSHALFQIDMNIYIYTYVDKSRCNHSLDSMSQRFYSIVQYLQELSFAESYGLHFLTSIIHIYLRVLFISIRY